MDIKEYIKPWTDYELRIVGRQPGGVENYRRSAEFFISWCKGNGFTADPAAIVREDIENFLKDLYYKFGNIKNSSRANKLAGLRSFFRYLLSTKVIKKDPTDGIPSPRVSKTLPSKFTTEELRFIFSAVDLNKEMGIRDMAMLMTAYGAGLRVSELCDLAIEDVIDKGSGYIRLNILFAKGGKSRTLTLRTTPSNALRQWLTIRNAHKAQPGDPVFVGMKGSSGRLSATAMNNILKKYASKMGITSDVFIHKVRTTFATDLYDAGRDRCTRCGHPVETVDLLEVAYLMGHSDPKTTRGYIAISDKVLRKTAIPDRRFKELLRSDE
ncbi:MAG: tyrosine-type recombinase/integrase [Thermodesulfovibrionia bacterium]|nr:tyrosine-type recombinase/integrase [Thermodesulfovibrionia bacterium]